MEVVAPDGTAATLLDRRGGSGDEIVDAVFDQQAATSVLSASAPFTGTWRPQGDLGRLEGAPVQGTWRLRVSDESPGDQGEIDSWGADVAPAECLAQPPPPPPPADRQPPGFAHRSERARGQWPDPPGFDDNSPRAHAPRP